MQEKVEVQSMRSRQTTTEGYSRFNTRRPDTQKSIAWYALWYFLPFFSLFEYFITFMYNRCKLESTGYSALPSPPRLTHYFQYFVSFKRMRLQRYRRACTKPKKISYIFLFNTLNSVVCCRADHFAVTFLMSLKRWLNNWMKQTAIQDPAGQNSCSMIVASFGLAIKSYSH